MRGPCAVRRGRGAAGRLPGPGRPAGAAARPRGARRSDGEPLTERERTILRFLGSGLTEREIARELFLSFNTVHSHVKSLYRKLGVSSRAEAVERALT